MEPTNNQASRNSKKEPQKRSAVSPSKNSSAQKKNARAAHLEALHDIEQDADLSIHSPNDYLDEGETARLGEEKTDLI